MNANQFTKLLSIVGDAGWVFAVPETAEDEEVAGVIIGTPDYVQSVLDYLPDDMPESAKKGH